MHIGFILTEHTDFLDIGSKMKVYGSSEVVVWRLIWNLTKISYNISWIFLNINVIGSPNIFLSTDLVLPVHSMTSQLVLHVNKICVGDPEGHKNVT